MRYAEEFTTQWESVKNYIISRMIESLDEIGSINIEEINRLLSSEKRRWTVPGQYNKIWLDNLREKSPEAADAFIAELSGFELVKVRLEQPNHAPKSAAIAVGTTAGGAVVGLIVTKLFEATALVSTIGTVSLGAIGLGVGASILKRKRYEAVVNERRAYSEQLNAEGEKLLNIVKSAENS